VPLIILAFFSIVVAWGGPPWDATASKLEHTMHHAQHHSVLADFGHIIEGDHKESFPEVAAKVEHRSERHQAHKLHDTAGVLALGVVLIGIVFAMAVYYYRALDPNEAKEQFPKVHAFLAHKWYFDEVYSVLLVRPSLVVGHWFRWFDTKIIDGIIDTTATITVRVAKWDGVFDHYVVDGLVNLVARVVFRSGTWLRNVQTGYIRSYVLFLVLAAIGLYVILAYFVSLASAG
jgi:NADH-quinone oxidoreductase subunit L